MFKRTSLVLINVEIDPRGRERFEHACGDARVCPHTTPRTESLASLGLLVTPVQPIFSAIFLAVARLLSRSFCGTVKLIVAASDAPETLHNHIDKKRRRQKPLQRVVPRSRLVRDTVQRDAGLRVVQRDLVNAETFHALQPANNVRRGAVAFGSFARLARVGRFLFQGERGMRRAEGDARLLAADERRDFDFARSNRLNVYAGIGQGAEQFLGDTRLLGHAKPNDRDLGDLVVAGDALRRRLRRDFVCRG